MGTNIRNSISKNNEYYLAKHEYLMARHFALMYPEWQKEKREIESHISYGFKTGGEVHAGQHTDPVVDAVEKAERYSVRLNLIERAAKIAGEDIWEFVLLGVTTECNYEHLRLVKGIPCCKDVYYKMYRKFFWILIHEIYNLFNGTTIKGGMNNGRKDGQNDS